MSNFNTVAKEAFDLLNKLVELPDYELQSNSDNIKVEKAPPPPVAGTYRMTGILNVPAEKVFEKLTDTNNILKLSTSIVNYEIIEKHDEDKIKVIYHEHKSPGFGVSARDFVIINASKQLPDGTFVIVSSSIEHPQKKERSGYVRGHLHASGYFLKPKGDQCELTYIIRSDPKGWIPGWVISMANKQLPENFKLIEKVVNE
jgi:hypothetical protein